MKHNALYVTATGPLTGKSAIALGTMQMLSRHMRNVAFFRPIINEPQLDDRDPDINLMLEHFKINMEYADTFAYTHAEAREIINQGSRNILLENIIQKFKKILMEHDFVLCVGTDFLGKDPVFEFELNAEIAANLGCPVMLVTSGDNATAEDIRQSLQMTMDSLDPYALDVVATIINRSHLSQTDLDELRAQFGQDGGRLTHKIAPDTDKENKIVREAAFPTHVEAMELVIALLTDPELGVIKDKGEIFAIGHRVLHGGEAITDPVLVDSRVKEIIKECILLGPLHNPANLMGIEVAEKLFPGVPNVAVFDTEFGMGMPPEAYMYALPYELYEDLKIRRYGFHGTSHKYIARKTAEYLGKPLNELRSITMHLGNGSSMSCVKDGKCFDTSMGLTPLEGLIMGTRCGSIDPAIVPFVMEKKSLSPAEADTLMNKKSGLLGLCGYTDMRDVHSQVEKGNERAALALQMLVRSIKKTLGSYFFLLDGKVDALVFTAGIGENDDIVRAAVCDGLEGFGIKLDLKENAIRKPGARAISLPDSKIPVLIIPTNEELQIALETLKVLGK